MVPFKFWFTESDDTFRSITVSGITPEQARVLQRKLMREVGLFVGMRAD